MRNLIEDTIVKMRPVLMDEKRARTLLEELWQDRVAAIWTIEDVFKLTREYGFACDVELAKEILDRMLECHDSNLGFNLDVLIHHIEEKCSLLGQDGVITVWDEEEL